MSIPFFETLEDRRMMSTTVYVSSSGSVKSLAQAVAKAVSGDKILFKRGETFYTSGVSTSKSYLTFGAYGTGAAPKIIGNNSSAVTSSVLSLSGGHNRIENLAFGDNDSSTKFTAISTSGSSNTITNCSAQSQLYNFVYAGSSSVGTTVSYCNASTGVIAYFVYTALGSRNVTIDHNYCNDSVTEHVVRIHSYGFTVTNNTFYKKASGTSFKSTLCVREGSDGYIARNTFTGGQIVLGPLAANTTATLKNVTFEYNNCTNIRQFQIFEGSTGIVIQNNTIAKLNGTGTVFSIAASNANRPGPTVRIAYNKLFGDNLISGDRSHVTFVNNTLS